MGSGSTKMNELMVEIFFAVISSCMKVTKTLKDVEIGGDKVMKKAKSKKVHWFCFSC